MTRSLIDDPNVVRIATLPWHVLTNPHLTSESKVLFALLSQPWCAELSEHDLQRILDLSPRRLGQVEAELRVQRLVPGEG